MRFLVDECLQSRLAKYLNEAGHEAVHASEVNLLGESDAVVMELARLQGRVLISADTDFGGLLAVSGDPLPSVILLRRNHEARSQADAVLAALSDIHESLLAGSVVTITSNRIRIRSLPFD